MVPTVETLLRSYPRSRPPLSPALRARYESIYVESRNGLSVLYGLTQRLESWMHRSVARRSVEGPILEIGAGTLNHLKYESPDAPYDVVEPFTKLYEAKPERHRVRRFFFDLKNIPAGTSYGRIVSIACLEHLEDLPDNVARCGLHLAEGGLFQAGIPSEGGFLWSASWRSSVGLSFFLRTGLSYGELMRHEHLSRAQEIIAIVNHFFDTVTIRRFPLPWHHFSLYAYLEARDPDRQRCQDFLARPSP